MDNYIREPWIHILIAKTMVCEFYGEEINNAVTAFVQNVTKSDDCDDVVAYGHVTDDDVIIKVIFSRECLKVFEEEEGGIDFFTDLKDAVVILKKYKVLPMLESNLYTSMFVLYINHITTWALKQKYLCLPKLPNIMENPSIQNKMAELWRKSHRNSSDENSDSAASQSTLTQLVECAQEGADVMTDRVKESQVTADGSNYSQYNDTYEDIYSPFTLQYGVPQGPDGLNYEECEIPQLQMKILDSLEEWKPDYCPPVSSHGTSSKSYQDIQQTGSLQTKFSRDDSIDGLVSFAESQIPSNPADYLEDCHLADQTQSTSDPSSEDPECHSPRNSTNVNNTVSKNQTCQGNQRKLDSDFEIDDAEFELLDSETFEMTEHREEEEEEEELETSASLMKISTHSQKKLHLCVPKLTPKDVERYSPRSQAKMSQRNLKSLGKSERKRKFDYDSTLEEEGLEIVSCDMPKKMEHPGEQDIDIDGVKSKSGISTNIQKNAAKDCESPNTVQKRLQVCISKLTPNDVAYYSPKKQNVKDCDKRGKKGTHDGENENDVVRLDTNNSTQKHEDESVEHGVVRIRSGNSNNVGKNTASAPGSPVDANKEVLVLVQRLSPKDIEHCSPRKYPKIRNVAAKSQPKQKYRKNLENEFMIDVGIEKLSNKVQRDKMKEVVISKSSVHPCVFTETIGIPEKSRHKEKVKDSGEKTEERDITSQTSEESTYPHDQSRLIQSSNESTNRIKISLKSQEKMVISSPDNSLPPPYQPKRPSGSEIDDSHFEDTIDRWKIQTKLLSLKFDLSWMKTYYLQLYDSNAVQEMM